VSRATFGLLFEGQGHIMTFQHTCVRPITSLFEVKFYNYFTGMITILRQHVACNIWVATVKAKVTAWHCIKIVSVPKLCYLKSDFTTTFDKLLFCVQYLFGEHYPVPTGSCSKRGSVTHFVDNACFMQEWSIRKNTRSVSTEVLQSHSWVSLLIIERLTTYFQTYLDGK